MTWSIRARLTGWYSAVMFTVLAVAALVVVKVQPRLNLDRLDSELARLMLTLEGVMRTEIGEGLSLQASADEASIEVVAPDRHLWLGFPQGGTLAIWGKPLPEGWHPSTGDDGDETASLPRGHVRFVRRNITFGGHQFVAVVGVDLDELDAQHRELLAALAFGGLVALAVAAIGGWWVGQRTLRPLAEMATQAQAMTDVQPKMRLHVPHPGDELGQLGGAFNDLLARLGKAFDAQRQFMADASHELRTPVSIVRTTAQVAVTQPRSDAEYQEALEVVAEQSARLTRLVDAMFLMARAEARGVPLRTEWLYLDELLAECVRGLRVLAQSRHVDIRITGATDVPYTGDPDLLHRLFGNILDNAVRHARANGLVTVQIDHSPTQIQVATSDDGPGIAEGDRERVFERFVRLDAASEGAGLGLPIARWIAIAHGGTLELSPSDNPGTTFVVSLPTTPSL